MAKPSAAHKSANGLDFSDDVYNQTAKLKNWFLMNGF